MIRKKFKDCRVWMPLEDYPSFDFSTLTQKMQDEIHTEHPEIPRKDTALLVQRKLSEFKLDDQDFTFIVKKAGKDTTKIYVSCPGCGRPSQIMYRPELEDRQPKYMCRFCHRLKYRSQLYQHTEKYQEFLKPMRRLAAVKKMLLNPRIKAETAEGLLGEYEALTERLKASPQYKIFKFRLENGPTDNLLLGKTISRGSTHDGQSGKSNRSLQEKDDQEAQTPFTYRASESKTLLPYAQSEDQDAAKTLHQKEQDLHENQEVVQEDKAQLVVTEEAPSSEAKAFQTTHNSEKAP